MRTYAIGNASRTPDNWAPNAEAKTVTMATINPPAKALKKSIKSFSFALFIPSNIPSLWKACLSQGFKFFGNFSIIIWIIFFLNLVLQI